MPYRDDALVLRLTEVVTELDEIEGSVQALVSRRNLLEREAADLRATLAGRASTRPVPNVYANVLVGIGAVLLGAGLLVVGVRRAIADTPANATSAAAAPVTTSAWRGPPFDGFRTTKAARAAVGTDTH
jgi:hypothetical protein